MRDAREVVCLAFLEEFPTGELESFLVLPAYERLLRLAGLVATPDERSVVRTTLEMVRLRADIANRDRALEYVAKTLAMFGNADARAIVDNALYCTRDGARPISVTVSADVAPFLKALDELSCALRGVTRPA